MFVNVQRIANPNIFRDYKKAIVCVLQHRKVPIATKIHCAYNLIPTYLLRARKSNQIVH